MVGTDRVCLTGIDADSILEYCAVSNIELEKSSLGAGDFSANADVALRAVEHLNNTRLDQVNVLVGDWRDRRNSEVVAAHHVAEPLPAGSIMHVREELYTVSANCNLLLQASELHLVSLCKMLGRYWGTFSSMKSPDNPNAVVERAPLTTEQRLLEYLQLVEKIHGRQALGEAIRFTCENAASQQEVNLQLALCLPASCNGFALCKPEMNYEVKLEENDRVFSGADHIKIDLYWPSAHFGLEYMGEKEHKGKLLSDVSRWYAAKQKGIDLWFVTKEQLYNAKALDFIARKVARRTRKKINAQTWPNTEEVKALVEVLRGSRMLKPSESLRSRPLRKRR